MSPATFIASGHLTLTDPDGVGYLLHGKRGEPCFGEGGFSDIREGAAVIIRDANGTKVALGALDSGVLTEDSSRYVPADCQFAFTVTDVPAKGEIFSVEVSHRGEVRFRRDAARFVEATLG